MREAIAGGWGTLAAMIRAHAFRDGLLMEGELLLGDAERLLEDEHVFVWIDVEQPDDGRRARVAQQERAVGARSA